MTERLRVLQVVDAEMSRREAISRNTELRKTIEEAKKMHASASAAKPEDSVAANGLKRKGRRE